MRTYKEIGPHWVSQGNNSGVVGCEESEMGCFPDSLFEFIMCNCFHGDTAFGVELLSN
jgi:hypothetical protein